MFRKRKKPPTTPPPERRNGDWRSVRGDSRASRITSRLKRDSRGMIHLRLMAKPTGLTGKVVDWLRYDYSRKLELDENGSLYYELCRRRTPRWIPSPIASPRNSTSAARRRKQPVILFTKKLMTMDFLALHHS